MSSSKNTKKDKGKAKQTAANYQQNLLATNPFSPLTNYPPLPYKMAVTKPVTKPHVDHTYTPQHVEHLFLTNLTTQPSGDVLRSLIQKTFGRQHFATDDLRKTQQFYELILVDTQSIDITHTPDKFNPNNFLFPSVLSKTFSVQNNGQTLLKNANFLYPLILLHTIIMTIGLHGSEHLCIIPILILGFSTSTTIVPIHFPYGSIIGGPCLDVLLKFFLVKLRKDGSTGNKLALWKLTPKKFNFLGHLMLPGYLVGSIIFVNISTLFLFQWFEFTK